MPVWCRVRDPRVVNALRETDRFDRRLLTLHPDHCDANIARQLGYDASTVGECLALAGIAARGPLTDSMPSELRDQDWLAEAYADRSAEAIARELGVGATAVRRAMRELGVEVDTNRSR